MAPRSAVLRCALASFAAVTLLLAAAAAAARAQADAPAAGQEAQAVNLTSSRVDAALPPFSALRSCLPFNVLLAAPAPGAVAGAPARAIIEADYSVITSTSAALEGDALTLSLSGPFESQGAINFTIVLAPGSELLSVANFGSGLVVLGPGHNVSTLHLAATSLGGVKAFNLTAEELSFSGAGVLGSSISGAFRRANVRTSISTGSLALTSATPVDVSVELGGITTLVADVPQGSRITGTADGLSKVQFTNGSCSTLLPFPAPSIFGRAGFGFGSLGGGLLSSNKCQRVDAAAAQPLVALAENPQWTCGILVDGALSCLADQGGAVQPIAWQISNVTSYEPAQPNAAAANGTSEGQGEGDAAAGADAAANAQMPEQDLQPSVEPVGESANAAGTDAAAGVSSIGDGTAASSQLGDGQNMGDGAASITVEPPAGSDDLGSGSGGGSARRLLQPLVTTPTFDPPGSIATGALTSGPGSYASGSGSVGGTTQTTSSQGGSLPQTTLSTGGVGSSIFNPIFVPPTLRESFDNATAAENGTSSINGTVARNGTADSAPPAAVEAPAMPVPAPAAPPATPPRPGAAVSSATSSRARSRDGVAVASTVCSSREQSLSMLVAPRDGAGAGDSGGAP